MVVIIMIILVVIANDDGNLIVTDWIVTSCQPPQGHLRTNDERNLLAGSLVFWSQSTTRDYIRAEVRGSRSKKTDDDDEDNDDDDDEQHNEATGREKQQKQHEL